ncbi:hypothetical protein [Amorphus coralli]|uniref:hypothetical protein n=1 Tax=Amorphus coralli TaxID=340680 RepID=UPI0012EB8023|nr:hypothetical protein [Amorphus coralli]
MTLLSLFQTVGAAIAIVLAAIKIWDRWAGGQPYVFLFGRPEEGAENLQNFDQYSFKQLWARISNPGRLPIAISARANPNDLSLIASKEGHEGHVVQRVSTFCVVEPGQSLDLKVALPLEIESLPEDHELVLRFSWRPAHSSGHGCRSRLLECPVRTKTTKRELDLILGDKIVFPDEE